MEKKEYGPLSILGQNELARILNISVGTLRNLRNDSRFPRRRNVAGTKGWLYREIEEYILGAPVDTDDVLSSPEGLLNTDDPVGGQEERSTGRRKSGKG